MCGKYNLTDGYIGTRCVTYTNISLREYFASYMESLFNSIFLEWHVKYFTDQTLGWS